MVKTLKLLTGYNITHTRNVGTTETIPGTQSNNRQIRPNPTIVYYKYL